MSIRSPWRLLVCTVIVSALLTTLSETVFAQDYLYATGSPSFATTYPVENGFINISNGNLHFEIAMGTYKQRGAQLAVTPRLVYDSRIWKIVKNGSNYSWQPTNVPNGMDGWRYVSGAENSSVSTKLIQSISNYCATPGGGDGYENIVTYAYMFTEPEGTRHDLNATIVDVDTNCYEPRYSETINPGFAVDASGYHLGEDGNGNPVVWDKNGIQVYPQIKDGNGNVLGVDASGNLVDTAGRIPVTKTVSGNHIYYDVLKPGGGTARYTITTSSIYVRTDFRQSAVSEFQGTLTAVDSIELPDGSRYSFTYNKGGYGTGYYGEMLSVTLPTGGTVTYGYTNFQDSYNNKNRWLTSRTIAGNTTTFAPAVITTCGSNQTGCKEKITVSRPEGDDTVYTLKLNNGAWNTQTDHYSGRVGSSNVLLSTLSEYDESRPCPSGICIGAQLITTTAVTNTITAGLMSRVEYVSNSPEIGKVSKIKQWDYYTGQRPATPTREINNTYGQGFNAALLVTENTILDASGNLAAKTQYGYDDHGNIASTKRWTDGVGTFVEESSAYDDVGNLTSSTDPKRHSTTFEYDVTRTCVKKITAPNTGTDHVTNLDCDGNTGLQLSTSDENGNVTTFTYDAFQRPIQISRPDGGTTEYSYTAAAITQRDKIADPGTWKVVTKTYDQFGRLSAIQDQTGGAVVSSTEFTYDRNGRLLTETNPHLSGQSASTDGTTTYIYDALDRISTLSRPNGATIAFTFLGNSVTRTDENTRQRKLTLDAFGRLTQVWEPNTSGSLVWATEYTYNAIDKLVKIDQKGGSGTSTDWRTRVFVYDLAGRLKEETQPESGRTQFVHDENGNLTQTVDARNRTVTYLYDELNRLLSKTLSDRSVAYSLTYDEVGRSNAKGRLSSLNNGTGYITKLDYDAVGRVNGATYCLPSQGGNCNFTTTAEYDLLGNLSSLRYPDGRVVKQAFDQANRLSSVTYDNWNGQSIGAAYLSSIGYTPAGQVSAALFGNGIQRTQSYNNIFVPTNLAFSKNGTSIWSKQFTWDPSGTLLLNAGDVLDSSHTRTFGYDQLDRLVSVNEAGSGGIRGTGQITINGSLQHTEWQDCVFDGRDWICTNYSADDSGSVSATVNGFTKWTNYYTGSTPTTIATGLAQAFNGDSSSPVTAVAASNVVTFTAKASGSSTNYPFSADTSYDSGYFQQPSFTTTTSGPNFTGGSDGSGNGLLSQTFNFDQWGNLKQSGTFSFQQNFSQQNQISGGGYEYDLSGNLTNSIDHRFDWDAEGLLKSVDSGATTYAYASNGQRVRKDSSQAGVVEYLYFGDELIAEYRPTTGAWLDYIYAGDSLIAEVDGTKDALPFYRIENYLGSLEGKTDSTGGYTGRTNLAPFGQDLSSDFTSRFVFAGLYRDPESNSDHSLLRQYSSTQGRWLSPDPFNGSVDLENPQSLNRYAYVMGNPLFLTDPDGLEGQKHCFVCDAIMTTLFGMFGWGKPHFTGSLKPRPPVAGGNFPDGESLGLPTGMRLPDATLTSILIPASQQCEFGACSSVVFSAQGGQNPSASSSAVDWSWWATFGKEFLTLKGGPSGKQLCVMEFVKETGNQLNPFGGPTEATYANVAGRTAAVGTKSIPGFYAAFKKNTYGGIGLIHKWKSSTYRNMVGKWYPRAAKLNVASDLAAVDVAMGAALYKEIQMVKAGQCEASF